MFLPLSYKTTEDVLDALGEIEYTGKANMGINAETDAGILKAAGVDIFCIGVTGSVEKESLYKIASTSKDVNGEHPNVYILQNYATLSRVAEEITNGFSEESITTFKDYSQCGLESKLKGDEGRIIGGEKSFEHSSWIATLFLSDIWGRETKPQLKCGGSIINELFILTAAQCLFERDRSRRFRERSKDEIIVKLGLVNLLNYTEIFQEFAVESIFIHDNYSPGNTYDYDIALLKLNRPITSTTFLRPVCLPPAVLPEDNNNLLYKPGEYGWFTSFGHYRQVRPLQSNVQYKVSKLLKELKLPIQKSETCSSSLKSWSRIKGPFTERMFCAGDGISGNGPCKGDAGGPFMQPQMNSQGKVYWTQVGIYSWSIGCGMQGLYDYYTNVQRFRFWIDEKIKEIVFEEEEV